MRKRGPWSREGPPLFFSLVWLIYLAFPIVDLLKRPWEDQLIGFPLVAFFASIYLISYRTKRWKFSLILGQIAIVGFFTIRYDVNYVYMMFYPSPLIGMLTKTRQVVLSILGVIAVLVSAMWDYHLFSQPDKLLQLLPPMLIMLFMPIAMRLGRRSYELRSKLQLANEEIARLSKNEERQRISRDLHDTLGHTLSLITLKSELAEKLIAKQPVRAAQEVRDIQATSRAALKQVRELVSGMNAVTVRDEIAHAKQILAAAGIGLELEGEIAEELKAPLIDNLLGMCLREAVTNIVKHSRAKLCTVKWTEEAGSYRLSVADNGVGTDAEAEAMDDRIKNGLKGMRDRLNLVDGGLTFESAKGRGTRVTFTVPKISKSVRAEEGSR
jgi:two-component system sensor histidine kinase DesK